MKKRRKKITRPPPAARGKRGSAVKVSPRANLRARLEIAEETLRAIRDGEVDTVAVAGRQGRQVFTLQDAGLAYRSLIESMNEGALMLSGDKTILYANECFARLVRFPLEQVIGRSFRDFLSVADAATLRPHMKRAARTGTKIQVMLRGADRSARPVQISVREMPRDDTGILTIGMVVTDMTDVRQSEARLRALTHRVLQAQEAERGRVALELHDNLTQLLCGIAFRFQTLATKLPARDPLAKQESTELNGLLGTAAAEVERISRNLRPSILDQLGLDAVLRDTCKEFTERTGLIVQPEVALVERLSPDAELTLYRILQEALKNVERHARARHVTVSLKQVAGFVQLAVADDGIGFDSNRHPAERKGVRGLGLLGMHERVNYVHGSLTVRSGLRAGTEIIARVPVAGGPADDLG